MIILFSTFLDFKFNQVIVIIYNYLYYFTINHDLISSEITRWI